MQKQDKSAPIVDAVTVTPGWEAALGAALGDDLEAPGLAATAADTATGWRALPALPDDGGWPEGIAPLAGREVAPEGLARPLARP